MSSKDNILRIVEGKLSQAEERTDSERTYLKHLRNTGVPVDSELSRTHQTLKTYYQGKADAFQEIAINLAKLFSND